MSDYQAKTENREQMESLRQNEEPRANGVAKPKPRTESE